MACEDSWMKRIDVLFFAGCPGMDHAIARARAAAEQVGGADIRLVRVEDDEAARRLTFLGSPTVRVNDLDVETASVGRIDFGIQCRVYRVGDAFEGVPPLEWIVAALEAVEARAGKETLAAGTQADGGAADGKPENPRGA